MIYSKLFAALLVGAYLPTIVTALLGKEFGVAVTGLRFGAGPLLFERYRCQLRLLPITSSVSFLDTRTLADPAKSDYLQAYDRKPLWTRLVLNLSGPLSLFLLALALLGAPAVQVFLGGFGQLLAGAIHPLERGTQLLTSYHMTLRTAPLSHIVGIMACKVAALNLLPIGGMRGLAMLLDLVEKIMPIERWSSRIQALLLVPSALLLAGWGVALVCYTAPR